MQTKQKQLKNEILKNKNSLKTVHLKEQVLGGANSGSSGDEDESDSENGDSSSDESDDSSNAVATQV